MPPPMAPMAKAPPKSLRTTHGLDDYISTGSILETMPGYTPGISAVVGGTGHNIFSEKVKDK